jgi:membrane peptidoglycan carboxypeptidase
MQEVLKSVVSFNNYMYVTDVAPGGKTGTTNDQYDIWFDGFTPAYAASIWIGTDENVEMSSMSTPAAALWGKIINQIPNAKKGKYSEMPSNVIQRGGDYFTKGTETGLSSWSNKEQKKKERKEAYKKWLIEREKHKKKVIDVPAHDEPIYKETKVLVREAWDETVHHDAVVKHHEAEIDPETGEVIKEAYDEVIKEAYDEVIHHPAEYETRKEKIGTRHVDEVWHYEYEKGWRDGDFKYKG